MVSNQDTPLVIWVDYQRKLVQQYGIGMTSYRQTRTSASADWRNNIVITKTDVPGLELEYAAGFIPFGQYCIRNFLENKNW